MVIREIRKEDNAAIADIVREVMTEFGADPKTTVLGDPSLNTMFENYQEPRAAYYVLEEEDSIVGGAGIKQLDGSGENICELQRMFLLPAARGKGYGKALMSLCIDQARTYGYDQIYLESLKQMHSAIALYEKTGFRRINVPAGNTGHGGCDVYMIMDI
jgi:putative acetyltransferase